MHLSIKIIDGRNIWKSNYSKTLEIVKESLSVVNSNILIISHSCSLVYIPCDLDLESNDTILTSEIKYSLAFAKQMLKEVSMIAQLSVIEDNEYVEFKLNERSLDA
jgi:5-methyltetrahydropteroyltriglutamate--homocysteine methyltransferase